MCVSLTTLSILTLLLAYSIYRFLDYRGVFVVVHPLNHESCLVALKDTIGNEDIVVLESQVALLAGDERGWGHPGFFSEARSQLELIASYPIQGSINFYDLKNIESDKIVHGKLVNYPYPDFHPHGLGLLEPKGSLPLLFVVNHVRDGDAVDVFEVHEDDFTLHFKYRVLQGNINLNDVEPVNENSFFVSRTLYYGKEDYQSIFELTFNPKWATLIYCEHFANGQHRCDNVLDALSGTNGVSFSKDRNHLLVAHMFPKKVDVFSIDWKSVRDPKVNDNKERKIPHLTFLYDIPVEMLVDNLYIDKNGDVYAAGHLNSLKTMIHLQDRVSDSPSKVVKITGDFSNKTSVKVEDVLVVDGHLFSGVSVAVHHDGKLVAGSVMERGVMVCPIV